MKSKVILVTGANKGIGFEIVRQLAHLGQNVILSARNPEKGQKAIDKLSAMGLSADLLILDITELDQIRRARNTVEQKYGKLDVLINNAAIMPSGDQSILHAPEDLTRDILNTNALAAMRMVDAFYGIMPRGGRIINMSSGGGSMSDTVGGWNPLYCISKSLLNAITRHQSYYLNSHGISVNAMCPGWVRTDMGGSQAPRSVMKGAQSAVWLATSDYENSGNFIRDKKEIPW